jgi:hypothetical protein
MTASNKIREQIDACRPGSSDLTAPALAELAQAVSRDPAIAAELARSQQFDASARAALNDLPVPTGLAERLIAAIESNSPAAELSLPPSAADIANASPRGFAITRRRLLVAGGSLALASLIAVSAYRTWRASHRLVGQDELADTASRWVRSPATNAWTSARPAGIALDSAVAVSPRQWRLLSRSELPEWSASVTAVDLASPRSKAILFVVRSPARFAVPSAPTTTSLLPFTGGFKAIAWQRHGAPLYILVVEEKGGQRLENFVGITPSA